MFCFTRIYAWLYYTGTAEGQIGDLSLLFFQDTSKKCQVCAFNGSWNLKETWGPSEVGYVVNLKTCSQRQWLHSSVGRASHNSIARSRVQTPLKSWIFFRLLTQLHKLCSQREDHSSFDFISAVLIWFVSDTVCTPITISFLLLARFLLTKNKVKSWSCRTSECFTRWARVFFVLFGFSKLRLI